MNWARLVGVAVTAPFAVVAVGWVIWQAGTQAYAWLLKVATPKPGGGDE